MITMGRPGSTKAVVKGMASVGIPDTGSADFVLGPELPIYPAQNFVLLTGVGTEQRYYSYAIRMWRTGCWREMATQCSCPLRMSLRRK